MVDVRISDLTAAPASAIVDSSLLELSTGSGGSSFSFSLGALRTYYANTFAQVSPSNGTTPTMAGTAAVGSSAYAARADHVHPTDTSRAATGANGDITGLSALTSLVCKGTGTFYGLTGGGQNANFGSSPPSIVNTGRWTIGWNMSGGNGETAFIANRGPGSLGGFRFYDQDNSGNNVLIGTLTVQYGVTFSALSLAVPLAVGSGGTGASTAAGALASLGAATQDDVRQLMIQVAKIQGRVAGYASGFADDYADQSGVDTSSSSGFSYDSTNKLFGNAMSATETSQSVPAQTNNSAPSGYVTSASSIYSASYDAWNAFDQSGGTAWIASSSDSAPWVQRQLPAAVTLGAYTIATRNDASQPMTSWTLQGSNNGSSWTTLDSQSGQSVGTTAQKFVISSANQVSCSYYRLNVTGYTTSPNVAEFGLLKAGTTSVLDLRSAAAAASIVPSKVGIFILVKSQGAGTITPNTNLIASVTRTRSASTPTWTQVTLVAAGTVGGFTAYEANGVDVSAQPSGSSMGTRLQTASGLAIAAQANVMQWAA